MQPRIPPGSPSTTDLSTAWISLDGLAEQWGQFGAQATAAPALHATGSAFAALACETDARECRLEAWHTSREVDAMSLEHTLDELTQARQRWTEVMRFLAMLMPDEHCSIASRDGIRSLVTASMEQRVRLSSLIQEIEREQLMACRRAILPLQSQECEVV